MSTRIKRLMLIAALFTVFSVAWPAVSGAQYHGHGHGGGRAVVVAPYYPYPYHGFAFRWGWPTAGIPTHIRTHTVTTTPIPAGR